MRRIGGKKPWDGAFDDVSNWKLEVDGLVDTPLTLTDSRCVDQVERAVAAHAGGRRIAEVITAKQSTLSASDRK